MSRSAAARRQKPAPRIRRARFAEEDLVSTFGEAMLAEAEGLGVTDPEFRARHASAINRFRGV